MAWIRALDMLMSEPVASRAARWVSMASAGPLGAQVELIANVCQLHLSRGFNTEWKIWTRCEEIVPKVENAGQGPFHVSLVKS